MNSPHAEGWVYRGVWRVLTDWLRVPREPPTLPHTEGLTTLRPSAGYLRYLKALFWFVAWWPGLFTLILLVVLTVAVPVVGVILAIPVLVVAVLPAMVSYVALHVKFDTTWYVLSDRSIRIRRGVWVVEEITITFENVQNVATFQGPLQRWFGISDVMIETAGGSSGAGGRHGGGATHVGAIQGVANAVEIREQIMERVRASRSAGLGDERSPVPSAVHHGTPTWTADHLAVLRQIRDGLGAMTQ